MKRRPETALSLPKQKRFRVGRISLSVALESRSRIRVIFLLEVRME
jgi:hypothetical protein